MKKASDLKEDVLNEQKSIVNNIISSLHTATVVEKEDQDKQAIVQKQEADRKQAANKKTTSLFDWNAI